MGSLKSSSELCSRAAALNDVDAALVALDPTVGSDLSVLAIGRVAGIASANELRVESPVEVSGRSGHRRLYTGGILAVGSIFHGSDRYCFRDLFELKRSSPGFWSLTGFIAPPVRPGDSGAWVIQSGSDGPDWCGVVIGGQRPIGLASFAENMNTWISKQGFPTLTVK
jgi:hypothetical protein